MPDTTERIAELEAKNERLKSWITAANQFAWAHEHSCPRGETGGECTCGLDQFLSRPKPFVESYKQRIAELEQSAAIKESHRSAAAEAEKRDASRILHALAAAHVCTPAKTYGVNSSWAISDLIRAFQDANQRAEAAEAKLATARSETIQECADWITETDLALPIEWHMGTKADLVTKFALALAASLRRERLDRHCYLISEETLAGARRTKEALAQIEQPQGEL